MSVNEVKLKKASSLFEVCGTGPLSSRTFTIGDEDHTLGNSLRHVLMQNERVNFAAYSVPHPSEPVVNIRVQTVKNNGNNNNDSNQVVDYPAIAALRDASLTLIDQCDFVLQKLEECIPAVKEDSIRMEKFYEKERQQAEDEEMEEAAADDGLDNNDGGQYDYDNDPY